MGSRGLQRGQGRPGCYTDYKKMKESDDDATMLQGNRDIIRKIVSEVRGNVCDFERGFLAVGVPKFLK